MTDEFENIAGGFDPFADAESESESQNYIHVRVQQRNGRKSLTTVQVWCACRMPLSPLSSNLF